MKPKHVRSSRQDWLDMGLRILRDEGHGRLTVDALCAGMAKTKGSFYHHFVGRDDFVAQLLRHWENSFTSRFIGDLERLGDARTRLRALADRTAREVDLRLERTIRMWADADSAAQAVVARVDRTRERYLREQLEAAIGDPGLALQAARIHLALLVGVQMVYEDLTPDEMRGLFTTAERVGFAAALRAAAAPAEEVE